MKDKLTVFTKGMLDFLFYAGMLTTLLGPAMIRGYGRYNRYFRENVLQLSVIFILAGIFAVLIIYELRKIFKTVLEDDCFVEENVVSLRKMGTYSFFIAAITSLRIFLYLTPAVMVVVLVFIIAGLFSKVLSQVFAKAVQYKLENDLTI